MTDERAPMVSELFAKAMIDSFDDGIERMMNGYDEPLRFQRIRRWLGLPLARHVAGFAEVISPLVDAYSEDLPPEASR